jgi:hypothetical protein
MAAKKRTEKQSDAGVTIQLHLLGIVVFSISLVLASALVTYGFIKVHATVASGGNLAGHHSTTNYYGIVDVKATNVPPWGQLVERDIDLEQPEEYVAYEISTNRMETWTFAGMNTDAVRAVMQSSGLTAGQIEQAFSAGSMIVTNSNTIITPDKDLVFSLPPDARAKLYAVLGRFSQNALMQFPFCFPGNSFVTRVDQSKISAEALALLQKMLYPRGDAQCFSDLGTLLRCVPDEAGRMQTVKALSHQSVVLLGIRVWPDTDIDKIIGYWSMPNGARLMDVRPLLDSLKREPNGGYASILYFLPPFARARLYTYPLPAQPGDPSMDCHWSTMNFFNETPDNRFSDPKYTVDFLLSHFYKIGKPTMYGDRIFVLNKNGDAIHSAVYLTDDIVFTKNGNNSEQPWMLMHLKDLLAEYTVDGPPDILIYRDKNW